MRLRIGKGEKAVLGDVVIPGGRDQRQGNGQDGRTPAGDARQGRQQRGGSPRGGIINTGTITMRRVVDSDDTVVITNEE